jgi:hypothetical protein
MIDDGLAEADVRDAIINVALGEDQRPLCLYLDKTVEEMAQIFSVGELVRRIATRTSNCVVLNCAISEKRLRSVLAILSLNSESFRFWI